MKAEDTVRSDKQLHEELNNELDAIFERLLLHPMNMPQIKEVGIKSLQMLVEEKKQAQAAITWDIARKETLKEVVDYFLGNCDDCDKKRPVYHFRLSGRVWEEKLKEWGIKDERT